jgi:hypothetical protein
MAIAIPSPPSSRQDPGILAQQSDVRCKRGRLCVILIAPAAHTSKGLAKAFVSSAGGKGPENRDTPAPLSPTLRDTRLPSEEQRTPEQGNKDYHPLRSGIVASRDPGGCFALVAVRYTVVASLYSSPLGSPLLLRPEARGCSLTSGEVRNLTLPKSRA